jgi:hypothetical protein
MGMATISVMLAALLGPYFLPPAPEVLFTQVNGAGRELDDSYRMLCGDRICRGAFFVKVTGGICLLNARVSLPDAGGMAEIRIVPDLQCTTTRRMPAPLAAEQSALVHVDQYGAATHVIGLASGPRNDPLSCDGPTQCSVAGYLRVDLILATSSHR